MDIREESQKQKSELRKKINVWKKEHPEWLNSEAMETAKSKINDRTWEGYVSILPIFCISWIRHHKKSEMKERNTTSQTTERYATTMRIS